jgi:GTPase SAR1 family protein
MQAAPQAVKSLHICLLGDPGCGHSAFLRCYQSAYGAKPEGPDAGRQIESFTAMVELDGEPYRARFTDNAGADSFGSMQATVLGSAHVVVLCFSIERPETMSTIEKRWLPLLRASGSEAPIFIMGLRDDLRADGPTGSDPTFVPEEQGVELARRQGAFGYLECATDHPETVLHVALEALQAGKEFYTLQWQFGPRPELDTVYPDDGAEDAPWLTHERLNVADDPTILDAETLRKSLSMLGATPSRTHAYLRIDLSNLALTSIDVIRKYQHLQFINISGNRLKTLEPLGVLRCLLHLNASFNLLVRTQSFTAPDALETVDMSYNMIGELGDWHVHKYLRELNLRGNFINEIGPGLLKLKELRMLDLSENYLSNIQHLTGLGLRTLFVAQNRLTDLTGVESIKELQVLNVRHNNITSMSALRSQDLPRLRKLCVADNRLSKMCEVENLASFTFLCDLFLAPNPIMELPHYREQVLHRLPRLRSLDAQAASAEEKVKSDLNYGADTERRAEIFERLLPNEQFVDRRLVTEEGIASLEEEQFGVQGDAGPFGGADYMGGTERTLFQEAQYRQRLQIVRRGGIPLGVADFTKFSAPFVSFRACNEDIQEILEACGEGRIRNLILSGADLTAAGVSELLSYLQDNPRSLRHVDLTGCAGVAELGRVLINGFPYKSGCSMEARDSGLTESDVVRLRNGKPAGDEALRKWKAESERSEAMCMRYEDSQLALEEYTVDFCTTGDPPPPPAQFNGGIEQWQKTWTDHADICHELSRQAEATYDAGGQRPQEVSSGQLIAHLSYLALGCAPLPGDALKVPGDFRLKHVSDGARPQPRHGEDLHEALASGRIILESAVGTGYGAESLELTLQNNTEQDVLVTIRRGSIFQQVDWQHRGNQLVAMEHVVNVPAGRRAWKTCETYCMNRGCACPNGNVMNLTEFYFNDVDVMQTQACVWDFFEGCTKGEGKH